MPTADCRLASGFRGKGRSSLAQNAVFKALGDPTRREILKILGRGELAAGALADHFDMARPSVSHHFAVLKEADLITSRREGQQIIYSLNTTVVQDMVAWMWDLFGSGAQAEPREKKT